MVLRFLASPPDQEDSITFRVADLLSLDRLRYLDFKRVEEAILAGHGLNHSAVDSLLLANPDP